MVPAYAARVKAKVCLLGGRGVGKTALVRRYLLDEFDDGYVATLGTKVSKRAQAVDLPGTGTVLVDMTLWDAMGAESMRETLADIVLGGAEGVLAVCDVTDDGSVAPMASWMELMPRLVKGVPVQILVNKFDLGRREEVVREALNTGRRHSAPCYLTSARTGDNVAAAFEDLALGIAARATSAGGFDTASLGMMIDAAVRPRSLSEFAASAELPARAVRARAESLLRRGHLRVASIDLDSDGRPLLRFAATSKTLPRVTGGPVRKLEEAR